MVQTLAQRCDEKAVQVAIITATAVDAELKVGSGEATLLSHHHISNCQLPLAAAVMGDCEEFSPTDLHLAAALQELAICEK